MKKNLTFNASARQVKIAYWYQMGVEMPSNMTYIDAGNMIVKKMGYDEAKAFIQSQNNNASDPYPWEGK